MRRISETTDINLFRSDYVRGGEEEEEEEVSRPRGKKGSNYKFTVTSGSRVAPPEVTNPELNIIYSHFNQILWKFTVLQNLCVYVRSIIVLHIFRLRQMVQTEELLGRHFVLGKHFK
jgi:hypothetical protein